MLRHLSAISLSLSISIGCLDLAAGGESGPAKEGEATATRPRPRISRPVIQVAEPFRELATGDYAERLNAFNALIPRAAEHADAARAEARRLRALEIPEDARVGDMIRFVTGCLEDLVAEAELIRDWKAGLGEKAAAVAGRRADVTCHDKPVAGLLEKAGGSFGVKLELSPAGRRLCGSLVLELEGSPSLREFLDWLCAEQTLKIGHAGDRLVLVPAASVRLAEIMARKRTGAGGG